MWWDFAGVMNARVLNKDDCAFLGNVRGKREIILWGRERDLLHYEEVSKFITLIIVAQQLLRYTSSCDEVLTSYNRFVAHQKLCWDREKYERNT